MSRVFYLAVLAGLMLVGCGPPAPAVYGSAPEAVGPGGKPGWVDTGRSARFMDTEYLTGVGRGPDQTSCASDARAALAKIFEAQISQVSQDWQGHFSRVDSMGLNVKVEAMSVSQLTRVSTDRVLKGTKVLEQWVGEGTHHCLGGLERLPAAETLRDQIKLIDAEIKAQIDSGDAAPTPTAKFMAYARAMERLQEREALNVDLRIVDPRGVGQPSAIDFAALVSKFTTQRGKIKVGLKLVGTKASQIQTCLAEELSRRQIDVLENTSDVDVMIHGDLKYEKAGFINGSEMVRADVNLRLTDIENGRTLSAFHDSIRVGRPTLQASVQLAVFKLCQQVMPQLVEKIRSRFK